GTLGDTVLCGDYDSDGKSDVTVWRPGLAGVAGFWVLQSSNGVGFFEPFGQTGDDPEVVGDYNDDGRDDFAVYRAGSPSVFYFR
ncbi:VCBS repeat-containing protein, partial [Arthrobacter sp. 260]|nr:VCBS repeat-containing protein [Arthrobacter sp. 260]